MATAALPGPPPTITPGSGGSGLSLGETSTTAYRGDRGKVAYDHALAMPIDDHGIHLGPNETDPTIVVGSGDPTTGGGTDSPVGSIFLRSDAPEIWRKIGTAATAWEPYLPDFEVKFTFTPAQMGQADDFITAGHFELPLPIPAGGVAWVTGTSNSADGFYLSTGDVGGGNTGFDFDLDPLVIANVGRSIHVNSDGDGNPHYYEITTNDGSTIVADEIARLALIGDVSGLTTDVADLQTEFGQQFPSTPVKPNAHRSKYITLDPGAAGSGPENHHLLDGTATHLGGQAIEDGQNLTVANNANGHGGIWTLHLGSPATQATGLGSVPGEKIGGYDVVYYTGTVWAEETPWRIVTSDPTQYGIDLIDQAWPLARIFRPSLIATTLSGSTLTVLNADGSTDDIDVSTLDDPTTPVCDVLVLDTLDLLTIDAGVISETEDFSTAIGVWISRGSPGALDHAGAVATVEAGVATALAPTVPTPHRVSLVVTQNNASLPGGGVINMTAVKGDGTTATFDTSPLPDGTLALALTGSGGVGPPVLAVRDSGQPSGWANADPPLTPGLWYTDAADTGDTTLAPVLVFVSPDVATAVRIG